MRKIIIFSTAYLPMQGGAELAVKEITSRLGDFSTQGGPSSGWEFDLICARLQRSLPKTEKIGNVNVYRIGLGNKTDKILLPFLGFLEARKIYTLSKIQNLTSEIYLWGIMASWGSLAALVFKIFNPQVPFLLTLQEGDAEKHIKRGRWGLIGLSWKWLLRRADFVQVISNYLSEMANRYGYKGKIEVVPNGVDLAKYYVSSIKYQKGSIKNELGINEGEKIIITVSRLVAKNGIEDLIFAVDILNTFYKIQNTKLLILGSGPLENRLKYQVKNLGLEEKVIFLGDIPNNEVPEYLATADVFVRPSLSEGLGTAFLEAMAAGIPVIGTRAGGIPDFLKDGKTGLSCEEKNPQSIAEKIKLMLENNELRNNIILNARNMVEEKYNWDKIAKQMEEIFDKLKIQS